MGKSPVLYGTVLIVVCKFILLKGCGVPLDPLYSRVNTNVTVEFSVTTPPAGSSTTTYRVYDNDNTTILQVRYQSGTATVTENGVTFTGDADTGDIKFIYRNIPQSKAGQFTIRSTTGVVIPEQCVILYILGTPTTPAVSISQNPDVGGDVTVTCSGSTSTTSPTRDGLRMTYSWTIDGSSNPVNSRYIYTNNRNQVTVSSVVSSDANKQFTCKATEDVTGGLTSASSGQKSFAVYYGPDNIHFTPVATVYEEEEGTTLDSIRCTADCYPSCAYTWTKLNQSSQIGTDDTLTLQTLHSSEAGTYRCTANNPDRTGRPGYTGTKDVIVNVIYGPESLALSPSPTTYIRNEGTSLQDITCSDTCYPGCTYTWTKAGRTDTITTTGVLSLGQLNRTEAGNYTCTARNPDRSNSPQTKKTVSLNVRFGPDAELINGESPYTVTEGYTGITIECSSDCYPSCTFSWTNITNNSPTGADGVISLAKVTRYDAGRYRCISSNTASQYNKVATSMVTVVVQYAPDVTATTQNVTVNDSHVDIRCSPSGVPASYTYQPWTQAWISEGRTIPLLTQLGSSPTLNLTDLSYQHSGVYTCRASNGVTESIHNNAGQGDVHLSVKSFPIITEPVVPNGQYHKVSTRLDAPISISVEYYNNGDAASVNCYKLDNNSRQISTAHAISSAEPSTVQLPVFTQTINTTGDKTIVTFTIAMESQLGCYVIVIKNNIGEGIVPVHIISEGPPSAPEELTVDTLHQTHVTLSWVQGFHGGYNQTFVIQLSLDNNTWWNKTSISGGKDTSRDHINATVDELLPGTQYYVRMFSYNQEGKSPFINAINFTTIVKGITPPVTPVAAIVGGTVGAIVVISVVVVVVIVVLKRRRPTKDGSRKGLELNDTNINNGAGDDSDFEVTENPTYDSSGTRLQASQTPSSSTEDNTYASVTKPKKHLLTQNSKDVIAEVQKPKKDGKEEKTQVKQDKKEKGKIGLKDDKKKKKEKSKNHPGGGDVYENAPAVAFGQSKGKAGSYDENAYENPEDCVPPVQQKKNFNKDGLVYADLSFKPHPKRQGKLVIHGLDDMTEYVQVDFTKKAEPLPDSDEEDHNANTKN